MTYSDLLAEAERRLFATPGGWSRARMSAQAAWNAYGHHNGRRGTRSIPVQPDDDDIIVEAALQRAERLEAAYLELWRLAKEIADDRAVNGHRLTEAIDRGRPLLGLDRSLTDFAGMWAKQPEEQP